MQAVRVHDGGVLVHETVPDPEPGPGEALVELRCAGLNRRDALVARGTYPFPLPLIPGSDGAGVRRDTGEEVVVYPALGWAAGAAFPGDEYEILGGPRDGTYAELVALPVANLLPKPARLSWEEAAAFPLAALTAYRALFTRARLQPGETVLVLGAGSGVSTFAVQLAAQVSARVLVTSSSDEKIERARSLGAEAGVNYAEVEDWPAAVKELGGADVVVDAIGSTWQQSLDCLRGRGGRVVVFGATGGTDATLQVRPFYFDQHSLLGTMMGSPDDFAGLLRMLDQGSWRPVVDSVRPLAEAPAAIERMVSGAQFGKLVLTCA
jgi:NADPH:quinone reductase-like Zn-dependent oxidoreductase